MLNSLKYAKILEDSGMPREQAETHIQILSEILGGNVTTKEDLKVLSLSFNKDLNDLSLSLNTRFNTMSTDLNDLKKEFEYLNKHLKGMESRLHDKIIIKLGTLMTVLFGCAATIANLS